MIITRTPLRISLGGGGTDLPKYYREAGHGFLIAAAITKYVYIAVHHNFDDDVMLKYSAVERVPTASDTKHPLLRSCLELTGIERAVEITSMADIPTGTGLGSSGSFTVGVLKALRAYRHELVNNVELAEQACHIEINVLGEPVGKQDQYIAAVGGLTAFSFHQDERVEIVPLELTMRTRHRLEDNLLLFFTGVRRSASEVLAEQQADRPAGAVTLNDNLDRVRQIGYDTKDALEGGDLAGFGELLSEQWRLKYERSPGAVHDEVDEWIRAGTAAGALGGKLVGAGGGGFLLFYAEDKAGLREKMKEFGLEEVRFGIDYDGASVIVSAVTRTIAILAGGLGTRVHSLTGGTTPKAMLPLLGRPFLDHKLAEAKRLGADRVVLLLAHGADQIVAHVGDGTAFGVPIDVVLDGPELLGTGGALKRAAEFLGERSWVTYGDTLLEADLQSAEVAADSEGCRAAMTVLHNRDEWEPSNTSIAGGRVVAYSKGDPPGSHEHIDYGYVLLPTDTLRSMDGSAFDLRAVLARLIAAGDLAAFEVQERFHDIGTPEAWAETESWLRARLDGVA